MASNYVMEHKLIIRPGMVSSWRSWSVAFKALKKGAHSFFNLLGLMSSYWIVELKKTLVSSIRKVLRGGEFLLP
jgi:hypothetical protein